MDVALTRLTLKPERQRRHLWLCGFALLGSLNLALGMLLALRQPDRADDLWTVYNWSREWLYQGTHLYASDASPDYPPNAIVTYALLAMIPTPLVVTVWAMTTLVLTPLLPYAVMRSVLPRVRVSETVLPTVLFACWGGVRTVLQFSQLSFLLAFASLSMPEHWIVGGVCLGLALAKPHIAGPIALWAVCARRIGTTLIAATVVVIEYGAYCLRARVTPLEPITGWTRALRETYSGPDALNGYTSLRPWAIAAIGDQTTGDAVWISVALIVLIVVCLAAVRDRTNTLAIPGLLCLWSLLTIYHNLNNLILMLPAFVFLLTADDPSTRTVRWWTIGIIQTALMLDIPVRLHRLAGGPLGRIVLDADRVVVLGTFVVVACCWCRLQGRTLLGHPLELRQSGRPVAAERCQIWQPSWFRVGRGLRDDLADYCGRPMSAASGSQLPEP
jgi:hypothetical protein